MVRLSGRAEILEQPAQRALDFEVRDESRLTSLQAPEDKECEERFVRSSLALGRPPSQSRESLNQLLDRHSTPVALGTSRLRKGTGRVRDPCWGQSRPCCSAT